MKRFVSSHYSKRVGQTCKEIMRAGCKPYERDVLLFSSVEGPNNLESLHENSNNASRKLSYATDTLLCNTQFICSRIRLLTSNERVTVHPNASLGCIVSLGTDQSECF